MRPSRCSRGAAARHRAAAVTILLAGLPAGGAAAQAGPINAGALFVEFSSPGKRLIPLTIIVASIAGGLLLERINPALGGLLFLGGTALGFVVAAITREPKSNDNSGNPRQGRR